jgi:hypothetical protein
MSKYNAFQKMALRLAHSGRALGRAAAEDGRAAYSSARGYAATMSTNRAINAVDSSFSRIGKFYNSPQAAAGRKTAAGLARNFGKAAWAGNSAKAMMAGGAVVGGAAGYYNGDGSIGSTLKGAAMGAGAVGAFRGGRAVYPEMRSLAGRGVGSARGAWSRVAGRASAGVMHGPANSANPSMWRGVSGYGSYAGDGFTRMPASPNSLRTSGYRLGKGTTQKVGGY